MDNLLCLMLLLVTNTIIIRPGAGVTAGGAATGAGATGAAVAVLGSTTDGGGCWFLIIMNVHTGVRSPKLNLINV